MYLVESPFQSSNFFFKMRTNFPDMSKKFNDTVMRFKKVISKNIFQ